MSMDYTVEEPYGPLPGIRYYNVAWEPIYGRPTMNMMAWDEEESAAEEEAFLLTQREGRRKAVEAFVLWTRDVEVPGRITQTLEEHLCSCMGPKIAPGPPQYRHNCPWCKLRKAFGLLGDV